MTEKRESNSADGSSFFQNVWEILFPFLLYYLVYNAAYLILAFLYQASVKRFGGAYGQFMTAYEATVSGVAGGLCSLISILPLRPMLKRELSLRRGPGSGADGEKKEASENGGKTAEKARGREGKEAAVGKATTGLTVMVIFACCVSLGLNSLLTLTGFAESSQTYRRVADRQYGVAFGMGLVLYGLISPLAEEVVFRGVIYNRLRRHFGPLVGIAASGIFFGFFHGNLVQGVYGTLMGVLIACAYERQGSFLAPVLFHAAANLAVYITAHVPWAQEALFTPAGCAALLAAAAGCAWAERRKGGFI